MHFQSGGQSARNFSPQKLEEGRNAINDALTTGGTKTVTDPATGKKTKSSDLTPETPIPDRLNAGVVDEQGNKIVVDPKTGKMMKQSDLEQPPVKVASAAVGGISDAPPPEAKAPAPVDPSKYETKLSPADEKKFQAWKAQYAPNDSGQDYDLRGAFKAGAKPDPDTGHMPDTWKKPNHPTFSDQSQYAKDRPDLAGHWDGETYVPPAGQTPQQAVIPLPQPRPSFANAVPAAVPQTEGQAWLNSKLTQIDSSIMKAQSVKSTMNKSLNNVLSADIASRQESGVPVTLSPDLQRYYGTNQLSYEFVSNHLGEGKAIEWEQAKEQADRNYSGVAHMELMPASDIHDRVESLRPVPGSPDYVKQRLSFVHAQKEEDRILKLRESDPAKAADMLDGPKSALENYKKDPTPENGQALTAARMEAQKYLEVDDAVRTPLTNQEASHLAKPFNNKGLLDPAGAANAAMTKLRELALRRSSSRRASTTTPPP
jgi:hypothetical protein